MIQSSRTTTKVSAVFLATVLIAGTIALSFPSFMIGSAQAQQYYGMNSYGSSDYRDDNKRYDSYGSSDYRDDNKRYDSYGSSDYRDDNKRYDSYGSSDYGMDNNYQKSYGNDNGYESQYQPSYKPDYKPQYPSYGKDKDDRDKSKDNKSVDIKKIKCNNININLNAAGGSGTTSNGNTSNGNGDNGNKTDGFKKIDRDGFTFICINNNNNVAGAGGGAGNETDGNVTDTCEECLLDALGPTGLQQLQTYLAGLPPAAANNLTEYCALIQSQVEMGLPALQIAANINNDLVGAGITLDSADLADLVACLIDVLT